MIILLIIVVTIFNTIVIIHTILLKCVLQVSVYTFKPIDESYFSIKLYKPFINRYTLIYVHSTKNKVLVRLFKLPKYTFKTIKIGGGFKYSIETATLND